MSKKFYAVAAGWKTGIFEAPWENVEEYVCGYRNAAYKGFNTMEEAEAFMKSGAQEVLKRSEKQREKARMMKEKIKARRRRPEFWFTDAS